MTPGDPSRSSFLSALRSRQELDDDYTPSRYVDSVAAILASWALRTKAAKAAAGANLVEDLAYGEHPRERIDLFRSERAAAPLLVFIHGGFWQAISKDESGFVANAWREAGAHVAIFDYGLAPEFGLPQIVAQARRGLLWLIGRAASMGVDPSRVVIAGHSAGAHLAAMGVAQSDMPLRGLILLSGVFDLEPVRRSYVNDLVGMSAEDARALSPLHLRPRTIVHTLVAAAEHEPVAFHEQSRALAFAWRGADRRLDCIMVPRRNHFDLLDDFADPSSALGQATAALLGLRPS